MAIVTQNTNDANSMLQPKSKDFVFIKKLIPANKERLKSFHLRKSHIQIHELEESQEEWSDVLKLFWKVTDSVKSFLIYTRLE